MIDPTSLDATIDAYAPDEGDDAGYVMVNGERYAPDEVRAWARRLLDMADHADRVEAAS